MLSDLVDNHEYSKEALGKLLSKKISRDMPTKVFEIEQIIGEKIQGNRHIELLGLWGGSKEGIPGDERDRRSLDSLVNIRNAYRNLRISLLFCDTHHMQVNGISPEECSAYYNVLRPIALSKKIYLIRLSQLIEDLSIGPQGIRDYVTIEENEAIYEKNKDNKIYGLAKKHSRLFTKDQGNGKVYPLSTIVTLYREYEISFLRDIKKKYPDTIFFSFSDPQIQRPIAQEANAPMFYFHADINGGEFKNHAPWYSGSS